MRRRKDFAVWVIIVVASIFLVAQQNVHAQPVPLHSTALQYGRLVQRMASHPELSTLWTAPAAEAINFRSTLIRYIDSLYQLHLIGNPYLMATRKSTAATNDSLIKTYYYLDAALATAFDLLRGSSTASFSGYDAISAAVAPTEDSMVISGLLRVNSTTQLQRWLISLEPLDREYLLIRSALVERQQRAMRDRSRSVKDDTLQKLCYALPLYRWLFHFKLDRFLLVNIAGAEVSYFEKGRSVLSMRAIVGKPTTPTPRFASYCKQLILYPYWYVPSSIAIGEYLSKIKRDPGWLDQRSMQVIDARGKVVDHHQLNWNSFSAGYFPFTIRQSTGCDNALGVLKFDIETPYGVYLHDTNNKAAFLQASRFLSHGCIRLEEPLILASKLLGEGLDTSYLRACFEDKKPVIRPLPKPLAVFCLYLPVRVGNNDLLQFYRDVYRLFAN